MFRGPKVFRWTQEEKEIIWVRNGQGWFQLNLKETLQGRLKDYSLSHNSKDKSHFKKNGLQLEIAVYYKYI